jgi:hypothetical protein
VDNWGPTVIDSYPQPEAVGVPEDASPWIRLDEYPGRGAVESAIFISPEPEAGFDVKIRGKKVIIKFREDLPENRTVVITFGAGISDRYGNQMLESFVLAFSTGMMVDNARIDGYIDRMQNPESTWIWGYPLSSFSEPDPREDKAPYATQPGVDGRFTLAHIPRDEYRLFAVVEKRRNRLWDSDREALAIPPFDVEAAETFRMPLNMLMTEFDLLPPTLRGAEALHRQGIRFSFSEPVEFSGMEARLQAESGEQLLVIDQFQNPADSSAILLTTALQRDSVIYSIRLDGIADLAGNVADSLETSLLGTARNDTVGATLSWSRPGPGATGVRLDQKLILGFSEAITLTTLPAAVTLHDPEGLPVQGSWTYSGSNVGTFAPAEPFAGNGQYLVQIRGDSLLDIFGNASSDSLVEWNFTTMDPEQMGTLSGNVPGAEQNLRIVARPVGGNESETATLVDANGDFKFTDLPAMEYRLWLYQDVDGNDRFTPGEVDPFEFAEPFWINPDTIRVRARWETEGIIIQREKSLEQEGGDTP